MADQRDDKNIFSVRNLRERIWWGDSFMTGWAGCAQLRDGQLDSTIFRTGVDEAKIRRREFSVKYFPESDIFTVEDRAGGSESVMSGERKLYTRESDGRTLRRVRNPPPPPLAPSPPSETRHEQEKSIPSPRRKRENERRRFGSSVYTIYRERKKKRKKNSGRRAVYNNKWCEECGEFMYKYLHLSPGERGVR